MQRKSWLKFDPWLLLTAIVLVGYGLLVLRSATMLADQPVSRQLISQAVYAVAGVGVMVAVAALDYRVVGALWVVLYVAMIGLLGLVLTAGQTIYGAQR